MEKAGEDLIVGFAILGSVSIVSHAGKTPTPVCVGTHQRALYAWHTVSL